MIRLRIKQAYYRTLWRARRAIRRRKSPSPTFVTRTTWKNHHGDIPAGHVIRHKDGDKSNNDIENLILIPRDKLVKVYGQSE